ncbi:MAG TPA: DUF6029 family protein, partial [Bacteroidia bacterium]|nr:DUF6029 family protein [Bacteroidia bacterium]
MKKLLLLFLLLTSSFLISDAQILSGAGQLHGSVEMDAQYYNKDSAIGAPAVPEKMDFNTYTSLDYTNGRISAGVRFEAYDNAIQGYDTRYNSTGIANKYISYTDSTLNITLGNFYE